MSPTKDDSPVKSRPERGTAERIKYTDLVADCLVKTTEPVGRGFPTRIETARLVLLKCDLLRDLSNWCSLNATPGFQASYWVPDCQISDTILIEKFVNYISDFGQGSVSFCAYFKDEEYPGRGCTDGFVGFCRVKFRSSKYGWPEPAIAVHPDHQGKGLSTEIATVVSSLYATMDRVGVTKMVPSLTLSAEERATCETRPVCERMIAWTWRKNIRSQSILKGIRFDTLLVTWYKEDEEEVDFIGWLVLLNRNCCGRMDA